MCLVCDLCVPGQHRNQPRHTAQCMTDEASLWVCDWCSKSSVLGSTKGGTCCGGDREGVAGRCESHAVGLCETCSEVPEMQ